MHSQTAFLSPVCSSLTATTFIASHQCKALRPRASPQLTSVAPRRARLAPKAELAQNDTAKDAKARMEKTIASVLTSFNTVRTGRASPTLLDRIIVPYYNVDTPLNQLAGVSISGTSTLVIEPYDPSVVGDIERAILESDLGMNPNSDGAAIRLSVPPLTEERRIELVKQVKSMAEDGRVALRNIRRDAVDTLKKLEKKKELGKDESKDMQSDIQKLTDKFSKQIDDLYKKKDTDIMKV